MTLSTASNYPIKAMAMLAVALLGVSPVSHGETLDFTFYVREYRVTGATKLAAMEVEKAVYPYLGPHRTPDDVESARRALETAYRDAGYQTVSVLIPQQDPTRGIIVLEVVEGSVSRMRVRGAKYHSPARIRAAAPSLAENSVPNMNDVRREILALRQCPERTDHKTILEWPPRGHSTSSAVNQVGSSIQTIPTNTNEKINDQNVSRRPHGSGNVPGHSPGAESVLRTRRPGAVLPETRLH